MLVEPAQLSRVHAEFARHLDLCISESELVPRLHPRAKLLRNKRLGFGHDAILLPISGLVVLRIGSQPAR